MLRKTIRQRREYLYTLEKEHHQIEQMNKKQTILHAQSTQSKIPTELFREKEQLQKELQSQDANTLCNYHPIQVQERMLMMSTLILCTLTHKF